MPIRGRLGFCTALAGLGAVTFLPFLSASAHQRTQDLIGFAIAVTVVATLSSWVGLRCADAVGLPMPLLRRLDGGAVGALRPRASAVTVIAGLVLGGAGVVLLQLSHAPALPGTAIARALSVVFAAGPLELVLHLGVMSVAVRLANGRRWVGIVAGAVVLALFHLSDGASAQPAAVLAAAIAGNATIGAALGWLYAAYGFEYAMLCHAIAHLIVVLAG